MITHALGYQTKLPPKAIRETDLYAELKLMEIFSRPSTTGIWYDPQDLTTLFQDAQGTLPVYRPGTGLVDPPVGLMMDKGRGLELGPELAIDTTPEFRVYRTATETVNFVVCSLPSVALGASYQFSMTVTNNIGTTPGETRVGSSSGPLVGSVSINGGVNKTVAGVLIIDETPPNSILTIQGSNTGTDFVVSEISIREIKGYHAYQTTPTARPTLSGRYNLLTATTTLSTQSVATVATNYTLKFEGAGTITLSGTATGTYSAGTHAITCTAGALTLTVAGVVTRADLRAGATAQTVSEKYAEIIPAPTHFVSKAGSDANDGLTEETAWNTILHAIASAPSGSVVQIGEGVYDEATNATDAYGITKTVSFVGDGDVVIRGTGAENLLYIVGSVSFYCYNIMWDAGSTQKSVYSNNSLDTLFYNCTFNVGSYAFRLRQTCSSYRIISCTINIPLLADGVGYAVIGKVVPVEVCGCEVTIGECQPLKSFISASDSFAFGAVKFNDNTISVQTSTIGVSAAVSAYNFASLEVIGNTLAAPNSGSFALTFLRNGSTASSSVLISGNTIYAGAECGYAITVGDDGLPATHNTKQAVIEDNRIYGSMYGTQGVANTTHGIFCGHISGAVVQKNFVTGCEYGVVLKGTALHDHSSGQIFGNLIVNNTVGIYNKGPNGTKIYNNTLVNNRIYVNTNDGANNPTGLEIINNAYLMEVDTPFVEYLAPIADLVSDYNFGSSLRFSAGTLGDKTLTQWQTDVSLDANSIVTTPLFDNEYRIAYPSDLWDSGTPITLSEPTSVDMFGYLVDPSNPNIGCLVGQEELLTPTLPVYQGIVNANTYDTAGFPLYLKRDLVDDKHTLVAPTGGIAGTRLQTTISTVTTTSETLAGGPADLFANPAAGPQEITQWLQFGWVLSAYELATAERFSKSKARLV